MRLKSKVSIFLAILSIAFFTSLAQAQKTEQITIGTGSATGVYYPTGGVICKLVNRASKAHNIHCSVQTTGGSIYNINTMHAGELDFGISQSDWQYHGYNGTSKFKAQGPFKKLRAVFSLYTEPFNIIVREDSNINSVQDLKGKRVNIGNPGSGDRGTMELVMASMGWHKSDFKLVSELKGSERSQAICDNKIDAFVYVVGHPNGSIKEASKTCRVKLISVTGKEIDQLVQENPYFAYTKVPGGMYDGTPNDVKSFGVAATLVSSTDVSDEVVYQLTKSVFEKLSVFKRLHPALAHLKKENMIKNGISIPLHPGAIRYYREIGLLE